MGHIDFQTILKRMRWHTKREIQNAKLFGSPDKWIGIGESPSRRVRDEEKVKTTKQKESEEM